MDFISDIYKLAMTQLDILLIVAIVFLVQLLKKQIPRFPKKLWSLVMIGLGFLAAFLVIPTVVGHGKEFLRKGLIYAAGSEFVYQMWRNITETVKKRNAK